MKNHIRSFAARNLGAFLAGVAVLGAGSGTWGAEGAAPPQPTPRESTIAKPPPPSIQEDLRHARALSRAFNYAAETIGPSVVHVTQIRDVQFRRGFADVQTQPMAVGAGSGVIVSTDGYVLTNNHVIEGAQRVRVKLNDGRELEGTVVGMDPGTDLGVVKITAPGLKAAEWGDSDALYVGEWVLAVGSPFGQFDSTFTAGIVSAKNRTGLAGSRDERFEDFIQTDAAINPGNSGGPLVNLEGKIVGINSQIATKNGGNVGLGFSIPAAIAKPVMEMISTRGRVDRGWIGVTMDNEPPPAGLRGVLINSVVPGGPASAAGLRKNDVVVRFGGRDTDSSNRLRNAIAFTPPDSSAEVEIVRDGEPATLNMRVSDTTTGRSMLPGGKALSRYGFSVETLPAAVAERLDTEAVRVSYVSQLGPAAESGLVLNDVILHCNSADVRSADQFDKLIANVRGRQLSLDVYRPSAGARGIIKVSVRDPSERPD